MPPIVATIVFVTAILGFFYIGRDGCSKTPKALWIPAISLFISCSRPVSMWLGMTSNASSASSYLEGSPFDRAVFMALELAGLAVVISRGHKIGPLLRKNITILMFFSFACISILWSDYPLPTFKHWIKGIGDVLMVLIILTEVDPMGALRWLFTRLSFLLFPLSILFIKYYPNLGRRLTLSWTEEAVGVAAQKNGLGGTCLVLGIGLLWLIRAAYKDREAPNRRNRLKVYGIVFGMVAWLLWQCNSTTSITSLVIAGGVMLLSTRPVFRQRPTLVHVLVVALLGISLYAVFFQSSGTLVKNLGKDPTLSGRTLIWSIVLAIPFNHWVGTGYESFWLGGRLEAARSRFPNADLNEAHDGYLEMYLNLGWAGVSLLGLLLLSGYRKVIRYYRKDPESGSLFLAFFLAAVLHSLTEAGFRMMTPAWIVLLLSIIAASQTATFDGIVRTDTEVAENKWPVGVVNSIAERCEVNVRLMRRFAESSVGRSFAE